MSHSIHNHGQLGYSAACYVTYNPNEHTPTQFVSPFNNPITGDIIQYQPMNVEEGDLISLSFLSTSLYTDLISLMMKELYYHLT